MNIFGATYEFLLGDKWAEQIDIPKTHALIHPLPAGRIATYKFCQSIKNCSNTAWHGWIYLTIREKYFESDLCKDCLIEAIKTEHIEIMNYLRTLRDGCFTIWADIAFVHMHKNPCYDPRGGDTPLSDYALLSVKNGE